MNSVFTLKYPRGLAIALIACAALSSKTSELCAQSTLGTISGVVTGDDGLPLAGVRVTASAALPQGLAVSGVLATGPTRGRAVSSSTGDFVLENVPAGLYTVCAQGAAMHLDPCNWGQTPLPVAVAANERVSGVKLNLIRGALVQIRLNDSKRILDSGPNSAAQSHVLMGVATQAGHFYPVFSAGSDSKGRDQKLLVPLHVNLELKIISSNVALADSSGEPLPINYSLPFRLDTAASQVLVFNVTGTR